jgi:hypothetical protein
MPVLSPAVAPPWRGFIFCSGQVDQKGPGRRPGPIKELQLGRPPQREEATREDYADRGRGVQEKGVGLVEWTGDPLTALGSRARYAG